MTPDEERLERYLEWKRATDRDRAAQRRRAFGYVAVPALCLVVIGLAVWLGRPIGERSPHVNAVTVPPPDTSTRPSEMPTAPPSPADATAQAPETSVAVRVEPPTRPQPRAAARRASRPQARSVPRHVVPDAAVTRSANAPASESDVAAGVASAPASPHVLAPREPPSELAREAPAPPPETPALVAAPLPIDRVPAPAPAPRDVVALPSPPPETPLQSRAPLEPAPEAMPAPGGAVAVAPPTVRERVATWAKGEVQEFRDGVKRELGEFRNGYEKVRGFFRR
jgi:hypothetical protein